MTMPPPARRYRALSVPDRDDANPAAWFVYDSHEQRSVRAKDRTTAHKEAERLEIEHLAAESRRRRRS